MQREGSKANWESSVYKIKIKSNKKRYNSQAGSLFAVVPWTIWLMQW